MVGKSSVTPRRLHPSPSADRCVEIPEYQRQQRLEHAFAVAQSGSCSGDACPETAYARALQAAGGSPLALVDAARAYCVDTAWHGAAPDRQATLQAQCELETRKRLADDLK